MLLRYTDKLHLKAGFKQLTLTISRVEFNLKTIKITNSMHISTGRLFQYNRSLLIHNYKKV